MTKPEFDRLCDKTRLRLNGNLVASTTTVAAQRRLGGYDHSNGYDHDCRGSTAAWWLRPRQRLRPRLLRLNNGGHYYVDDGDGCGGLATEAIATLAMVTIAVRGAEHLAFIPSVAFEIKSI